MTSHPPFTQPLPPVSVRDRYSKNKKLNDSSGPSRAYPRQSVPPSRGARKPLPNQQSPLGPGLIMRYDPSPWGGEHVFPPPPKPFTLVQHNCLGNWDVFLSLFGLFTQLAHPPSIVALQDPLVYRGKLPSFHLFLVFPPLPIVAGSPALLFVFIVLFWLLFPFCPASSEGVMSWHWSSSPLTAFSTLLRLASRLSTPIARRVILSTPSPFLQILYFLPHLSLLSLWETLTFITQRRTPSGSSKRMSLSPRHPTLTGVPSWASPS